MCTISFMFWVSDTNLHPVYNCNISLTHTISDIVGINNGFNMEIGVTSVFLVKRVHFSTLVLIISFEAEGPIAFLQHHWPCNERFHIWKRLYKTFKILINLVIWINSHRPAASRKFLVFIIAYVRHLQSMFFFYSVTTLFSNICWKAPAQKEVLERKMFFSASVNSFPNGLSTGNLLYMLLKTFWLWLLQCQEIWLRSFPMVHIWFLEASLICKTTGICLNNKWTSSTCLHFWCDLFWKGAARNGISCYCGKVWRRAGRCQGCLWALLIPTTTFLVLSKWAWGIGITIYLK